MVETETGGGGGRLQTDLCDECRQQQEEVVGAQPPPPPVTCPLQAREGVREDHDEEHVAEAPEGVRPLQHVQRGPESLSVSLRANS